MKNTVKLTSMIAAIYLFTGYQELSAQTKDSLKEKQIEEVVMIGYGRAKKIDVTSAIATVKSEDLAKTPSSQVGNALQGKVAGVNVISNGAPGSTPSINIRGIGSIQGKTAPLYVVDGAFLDDIDFLNPSDIQDLTILKDASACAIYGVKAAGGVVLITTKGGKFNRAAKLSYNGFYGVQKAVNVPTMANAQEFTNWTLESGSGSEIATINNAIQRFGRSRVDFNIPNMNTDWYKETLKMAMIQSHELSFDGGTDKIAYSFGTDYLSQDGILKMKNSYDRFNFRAKIDAKLKDWLNVGTSMVYSKSIQYAPDNSVWQQIYYAAPIFPKYDPLFTSASPYAYGDAKVLGFRDHQNPFATMDNQNNRGIRNRILINTFADISLIPKHLNFKTSLSYNNRQDNGRLITLPYYVNDAFQQTVSQSSIKRTTDLNENIYWDNTLTYNNNFGDHEITAMVGSSYRDESATSSYLTGYFVDGGGFVRDVPQTWYIQNTDAISRISGDGGYHYYGMSYFGRISYKYKNKYILYATDREEGTSRNNAQHKINLPAFGAAWVVSEEGFMQNQKIFDLLKLRAGWGRLADENVQAARFPSIFTASTVFNNQYLSGFNFTTYNDFISYQYTEELNLGISAEFLNRKLSLEADYYNKDTKELVIPIYPLLGDDVSYRSVGLMKNKGLEITANWRDKFNENFGYSITANFSKMSNEITNLGSQDYYTVGLAEFPQRIALGQPYYSFYGYEIAGVYQNQAEINADPLASGKNLQPGYFKYKDLNGDGVIDGSDRTYLGAPLPTYTFGGTVTLNYKQWDFSATIYGQGGNVILDRNRAQVVWTQGLNIDADLVNNRWHGEGTSNDTPSSAGFRDTWNQKLSSFWLNKGDFVRLQNVQLGYNFRKTGFPEMRFTLTADRPLLWTKSRDAFNVEAPATGTNQNLYPSPATFSFGYSVKF